MAEEPKDPTDEYDAQHGRPEGTPDQPKMSEADLYGTSLNPVRETITPFSNLREQGK
jgi:hypothetical protein